MAILTKSGRAAIAAAIKSQPLYLALGAGSPHWDTQFETTVTLEPDIPVALYAPAEEISVTAADGTTRNYLMVATTIVQTEDYK